MARRDLVRERAFASFDDDRRIPFRSANWLDHRAPDFVQQVLDEANAALEANAPTDCA